jgi:hypothetical protein
MGEVRVHLVLWNAARRLALLVVASLALVATPFVRDARIGALPAAAAGIALALLAIAAFPMARARRFLRKTAEPPAPTPTAEVYRTSARSVDHEPEESDATREAAIAFLLLAVSGAFTIVAAASR